MIKTNRLITLFSTLAVSLVSGCLLLTSCSQDNSYNIYIDSEEPTISGLIGEPIHKDLITAHFSGEHEQTTNDDIRFSCENLPNGISLVDNFDGTCFLKGSPTKAETMDLVFDITDGVITSFGTVGYSVGQIIVSNQISIIGEQPINGMAGENITPLTLKCVNSHQEIMKDASFTVYDLSQQETLPSGIHLHDNHDGTCIISGSPMSPGKGVFNILATRQHTSATVGISYSFEPNPNQLITVEGAHTIYGGKDIEITPITLEAKNCLGQIIYCNYSYADPNKQFPPGIDLVDNNDGTATISGTPTQQGFGSVQILVQAYGGIISDIITINYDITLITQSHIHINGGRNINVPCDGKDIPPLNLTCVNDLGAIDPNATFSIVNGNLPDVLRLVDNGDGTAVIYGTIMDPGNGVFSVQAIDGALSDTITIVWQARAMDNLLTIKGAHNLYGYVDIAVNPIKLTCYDAKGNVMGQNHAYWRIKQGDGTCPSWINTSADQNGNFVISGTPNVGGSGYLIVEFSPYPQDYWQTQASVVIYYAITDTGQMIYIDGGHDIKGREGTAWNKQDMSLTAVNRQNKPINATWSIVGGVPPFGLSLKTEVVDDYNICWFEGVLGPITSAPQTGTFIIQAVTAEGTDQLTLHWRIIASGVEQIVGDKQIYLDTNKTASSDYALFNADGKVDLGVFSMTITDASLPQDKISYSIDQSKPGVWTVNLTLNVDIPLPWPVYTFKINAIKWNGTLFTKTVAILPYNDPYNDPHIHYFDSNNNAYLSGPVNGSKALYDGPPAYTTINSLRINIINEQGVLDVVSQYGQTEGNKTKLSLTGYHTFEPLITENEWTYLKVIVNLDCNFKSETHSNYDLAFGDYSKGTDVKDKSWMNANGPANNQSVSWWYTFFNSSNPPSGYTNFIDWMNYTYIVKDVTAGDPVLYIQTDNKRNLTTVWDFAYIKSAIHHHHYENPQIW